MKNAINISMLALLILPAVTYGQKATEPLPDAPSSEAASEGSKGFNELGQRIPDSSPSSTGIDPVAPRAPAVRAGINFEDKVHYYLTETYFNPSAFTAPAFRAGLRMANPPGRGGLNTLPSGDKALRRLEGTMAWLMDAGRWNDDHNR